MNYSRINCSIRTFCRKINYHGTSQAMKNDLENSSIDLESVFSKFFEKKLEKRDKSKLSFSFKVNNQQSKWKNELKKRLANMNDISPKKVKNDSAKKLKTAIIKTSKAKIPETFLQLLDELCIDRKNARKFFENPKEWTFVKSDRKIFCISPGKIIL